MSCLRSTLVTGRYAYHRWENNINNVFHARFDCIGTHRDARAALLPMRRRGSLGTVVRADLSFHKRTVRMSVFAADEEQQRQRRLRYSLDLDNASSLLLLYDRNFHRPVEYQASMSWVCLTQPCPGEAPSKPGCGCLDFTTSSGQTLVPPPGTSSLTKLPRLVEYTKRIDSKP